MPDPGATGTAPGAGLAAPLAAQFERLSGDWRAIVDGSDRAARNRLCDYIDQRIQRAVTVFPPRPLAALDLIAPALLAAAAALGEITGAVATEAMLDGVFARFCIGK